jgi:hypothetical protein
MRKQLPGVASATKKLADGTRRKYYYPWRGGPLLKADDGTPLQPDDPRFFVAYTDAPWILEPSATELYENRICTSLPSSLRIA